jgi:hypothetical protein
VDASASSRASRARTSDVEADGEVLWFGRPDAGVKLAMMSGVFSWHHAGDGDNKARSPRRARRKPLKPSRRKCRMFFGGPVVTNARAFYTTRAATGALSARHFLRPLRFGAELLGQNSGEARRENAKTRVTSPPCGDLAEEGRGCRAPKREPCFADPPGSSRSGEGELSAAIGEDSAIPITPTISCINIRRLPQWLGHPGAIWYPASAAIDRHT